MSITAQSFLDAINNISARQVSSTPIDVTIVAEVQSTHNVDIGEYKVTYESNTFSAFSSDPLVTYKKGEQVYVLVPQGDYSNKKIILGRSSYHDGSTYAERVKMSNFYIKRGPNWVTEWYPLDHQPLQITAVPYDNKGNLIHPVANWQDIGFSRAEGGLLDPQTRYPTNYLTEEQLTQNDEIYRRYADTYDYIMLSADFQTNFSMTHAQGKYGLRVECLVDNVRYNLPATHKQYDPDAPEYIIQSFDLSLADFVGSPYGYVIATPNSAAFKVPAGTLKGVARISLFQDGNFLADITPTYDEDGNQVFLPENRNFSINNITVSNIDIRFAEKVVLTDNLYYCWIETPYGDAVYSQSIPERPTGKDAVTLEANLWYGYKDILSEENCRVYWFRQKWDVDRTWPADEDKDEYNKTYVDYAGVGWYPIEKLDDADNYDIKFNRLTIKKEAVAWKWRYKAVVVYNNEVTMDATQDITRLDSKYNLVIENPFFSLDLTKQYTRVDDLMRSVHATNPNTGELLNQEWICRWFVLLQDESYQQIYQDDQEMIQGPLDITGFLNHDVVTFRAMAYDPLTDPINTQAPEVGCLELTITNPEGGELYINWEGDLDFYYDSNGQISHGDATTEYTAWPLLTWKEGAATDFLVTYVAPDGKQWLKGRTEDTGSVYSGESSMMYDIWVDANNSVHFKVRDSIDLETYPWNDVVLTLKSIRTGEEWTSRMPVSFNSNNNLGANGSEWRAYIQPTTKYAQNGSVEESYTRRMGDYEAAPIVLRPNGGNWEQDLNYPVFLRPFVFKKNQSVENKTDSLESSIDPTEGYFYKVFWDVRYPKSSQSDLVRYSSFLRLYSIVGGVPYPLASVPQAGETNPAYTDGLQAVTQYTRVPEEHYGALEVRWCPEGFNPSGATLEECHYNFLVHARVEIFQGTYLPATRTINTQGAKRITVIDQYHPIDVFFNVDDIDDFDPALIWTNWPKDVMYDSAGYNPVSLTKDMVFRYGPQAHDQKDPSWNWFPDNLTPDIQKVTPFEDLDIYGARVKKKYFPKPYYFWQEGYNGALRTRPNDGPPEFGAGFYVRNQIFRLDPFGNKAINGWDGQSISLDHDNGAILAPTVGAGYKNPFTNQFTGVVMGIDTAHKKSNDPTNIYFNNDAEDIEMNPYMVGLYGYQKGVSSFGIMENGTAFFGRADQGGRIIIDGFNGAIYGGANGFLGATEITDPMWNTMRLNLVDITHAVGGGDWHDGAMANGGIDVAGSSLGFNGQYFGDNTHPFESYFPRWYSTIWQHAWIQDPNVDPWYTRGLSRPEVEINYWDNPASVGRESSFKPSRASTTPAIEIGQHPTGLRPGLLEWGTYKTVLRQLKIPGDRNFMITYDGTLWAMNGVFMGNVIGSNIVGGRFQGGEVGIGGRPNYSKYKEVFQSADNWKYLQAPYDESRPLTDSFGRDIPHAFFVDANGNAFINNAVLYGGRIDVDGFHIDGGGNLFQFGHSNFIGPTHIYGNIGIGPNLREGNATREGNLYQTYGKVGLGIYKPNGDVWHAKTDSGNGLMNKTIPYSIKNSPFDKEGKTDSLQHIAFLGIDSAVDLNLRDKSYQGHFWPLYFRFSGYDIFSWQGSCPKAVPKGDNSKFYATWATTMNMFKAPTYDLYFSTENAESHIERLEGENYFRVGSFGVEASTIFIRKTWQDESEPNVESLLPHSGNTYGFFGRVNRNNPTEEVQYGVGYQTWGKTPLILQSDGNTRFSSSNQTIISANQILDDGTLAKKDLDRKWGDHTTVGVYATFGSLYEKTIDNSIRFTVKNKFNHSAGIFLILNDTGDGGAVAGLKMQNRHVQADADGIVGERIPEVTLFSTVYDLHIRQGEHRTGEGAEIYMAKEKNNDNVGETFPRMTITAKTLFLGAGFDAHKEPGPSDAYIKISDGKITFANAIGVPENQTGIYARFG